MAFEDFDEEGGKAIHVKLEEAAGDCLVAKLEHLSIKRVVSAVTCLALRLTIKGLDEDAMEADEDGQVFINDIALFGVPNTKGTENRSAMWTETANLIVSPVLTRRRWGEEEAEPEENPENDEAAEMDEEG